MTIAEVLRKVDMMKPNRFTKEQKIGWLDDVERQIWYDVVCTHENPMGIRMARYDVNSDPDTDLIAPPPYDDLYVLYLECQIDLGNMEIGKYNNNRVLFNNAMMSFRDYWNRTFVPCDRAQCFVFDSSKRGNRIPYNGQQLHSMGNPLDIDEQKKPARMPGKTGQMKLLKPVSMKSVAEEIVQIHATDVIQQKQIDEVRKKDTAAMTADEVGDIIGG